MQALRNLLLSYNSDFNEEEIFKSELIVPNLFESLKNFGERFHNNYMLRFIKNKEDTNPLAENLNKKSNLDFS